MADQREGLGLSWWVTLLAIYVCLYLYNKKESEDAIAQGKEEPTFVEHMVGIIAILVSFISLPTLTDLPMFAFSAQSGQFNPFPWYDSLTTLNLVKLVPFHLIIFCLI